MRYIIGWDWGWELGNDQDDDHICIYAYKNNRIKDHTKKVSHTRCAYMIRYQYASYEILKLIADDIDDSRARIGSTNLSLAYGHTLITLCINICVIFLAYL